MSDLFWAALRLAVALPLVLLLAVVTVRWGVRRGWGAGAGRRIRVLEPVALGRGAWLALVAVGRRYYLLAVGERGARVLAAFDDLPEEAAVPGPAAADAVLGRLAGHWQRLRAGVRRTEGP
ncbi:MAG: flagellar biosynthetic protein FliO [Firmicutes bacterium]|nr:flagellar biosynthetic protein FliO [Bacillota bacterium]